jgi:hypothetical protein
MTRRAARTRTGTVFASSLPRDSGRPQASDGRRGPRPTDRPHRRRAGELPSGDSGQALLATGRLKPGTRLHGTHRGTRHEVRLDDEGRLWLDDDAYWLPDDAGKTATGRKTCAGWKFWHVDLADGTAVPLGDFRDDPSLIIG